MSPVVLSRFAVDRRGVSAVEFAVALPMLVTLLLGGFVATQAIAISRKVTITTRTLADLTSQYSQMSSSDMTTVMNASTQILAPYDSSPIAIRISQITTNLLGTQATVNWSAANSNSSAYTANSVFTLPSGLVGLSNMTLIYAETAYPYTSPIGTTILGSYTFGDHIYMLPRLSSTVTYTGS